MNATTITPFRIVTAIAVALAMLASPLLASAAQASDYESEVVAFVNAERANHGLPALARFRAGQSWLEGSIVPLEGTGTTGSLVRASLEGDVWTDWGSPDGRQFVRSPLLSNRVDTIALEARCRGARLEVKVSVVARDARVAGRGEEWPTARELVTDSRAGSSCSGTSSSVPEPAAVARPAVSGISGACPAGRVPRHGFGDVERGGAVGDAVSCVSWWGVAAGRKDGSYGPGDRVTRGQMATFIANAIRAAGGNLPAAEAGFADVPSGHAHAANIGALRAAGLVNGVGGDSFDPSGSVTRGQMAAFLTRSFAYVSGRELPAPSGSYFVDVPATSTHGAAVGRAVELGVAAGRTADSYGPSASVTRGQMALFISRWLNVNVEQGRGQLPA